MKQIHTISESPCRRRAVIVERSYLLRAVIRKLVSLCPALEIMGEFPDWPAVLAAAPLRPDRVTEVFVTVADPRSRWTAATVRELERTFPAAMLVICASEASSGPVPHGWTMRQIPSDASPRQFFVACGLETRTVQTVSVHPAQALSDREYQVYLGLARGESLKQIAGALHVTPSSVNVFRRRALTKLGLTGDSELVRHAVSVGLVPCQWDCGRPCGLST